MRIAALATIFCLFACSPPRAAAEDSGRSQVALLDLDAADAIRVAQRELAEGNPASAARFLQAIHEEYLGKNRLIPSPEIPAGAIPSPAVPSPAAPEQAQPRGNRVYIAITPYIVRLLRELPAPAAEAYRTQFDVQANSLHRRAAESGDPAEFTRMSLLYPAASLSVEAAITAAQIHLARDQRDQARDILQSLSLDAISDLSARARAAECWLVLAAAARDPELYDQWVTYRLRLSDAKTPIPARPEPDPARSSTPPKLPFLQGRLAWDTPVYRNRFEEHTPPTAPVPYFNESRDWVAFTTHDAIYRRRLAGGVCVQEAQIRVARGQERAEQGNREQYHTVGKAGVLVASYIRRVLLGEEFWNIAVKQYIPLRGLRAVRAQDQGEGKGSAEAILWDTANSPDPLISELSFNAEPVIDGDRIYALGWKDSGFVVAYLVCLELATGREIWSTILAGDQIELTLFGYLCREPFLGSMAGKDGVLYVSTNLGAVAAVRAHDGGILWLTEYEALVPEVSYHGRLAAPEFKWDRNPMLLTDHLLFVTPLDSHECLALDTNTGEMRASAHVTENLNQRWISEDPVYLLGVLDGLLVFAYQDKVVLVPADDIEDRDKYRRIELKPPLEARPALVDGGVVYATRKGIYHRDFHQENVSTQIAASARPSAKLSHRSSQQYGDWDMRGAVNVIEPYIFVMSSFRAMCYEAIPEPAAQPPGEKR